MVALLRGINVGGNRKVPMPELCSIAAKTGLTEVRPYINSGNIVFEAGPCKPHQVVSSLEKAIESSFGFHVDVIVKTASQWKRYSSGNPFPTAARTRPHLLHLGLSQRPCGKGTESRLSERALNGERIQVADDAIWVDFNAGVGKSKLTPAWFDKVVGSAVTMRNWNTVLKLAEMLEK